MALWERSLLVIAVSSLYALLCVLCAWQFRRRNSHVLPLLDGGGNSAASSASVLVAYASQSGVALALAQHSASALQAVGPVRVLPLDRVTDDVLAATEHAFFVASTYGEGEPPDNGNRFARKYLNSHSEQFTHLKYAVLALGDSAYQHFCAFGHQLHHGLSGHGAVAAFAPLELDGNNVSARADTMQRWYQQLQQFGADLPSELDPPVCSEYQPWRLVSRQVLNVGSVGEPLVHVKLTAPQGGGSELSADSVHWQAGDIAEVIPRNSIKCCEAFIDKYQLNGDTELLIQGEPRTLIDELSRRDLTANTLAGPKGDDHNAISEWLIQLPLLSKRDYSIASIEQDGSLDLLVRVQCANGMPGVASNYLGTQLNIADTLLLRLRSNPMFHAPAPTTPLILIGNGSGFAGLRAHLQARKLGGSRDNWLMFGERSPTADRIFRDEISALQNSGYLPRIDLTFSRCANQPAYVQDAILVNAEPLKAWVATGAAIYVCGSREGMAEGVDRQLRYVLGDDCVDALSDAGLYRRDVY